MFDKIYPSNDLSEHWVVVKQWLLDLQEEFAILSAILAVAQPELYAVAREALVRLGRKHPELEQYLKVWSLMFNVISLIGNRESPGHRDQASSRPDWYDLLVSIGGGEDTVMEIASLSIRCKWPSGSVCMFSGRSLLHGVSESDWERLCIACYMRQPVLHAMGVSHPEWPYFDEIVSNIVGRENQFVGSGSN